MNRLMILMTMAGILIGGIALADEIYRWVDKNGTIVFSDSPPPQGSFKKQNVEDEIDRVTDQKKKVDKQTDLREADKLEEKLKLEIEYEKKARAIKNYDAMRDELEAVREKYQKKIDNILDRGSSGRTPSGEKDASREIRELKKQYENEVRAVKNHYGYY